PAGILRAMRLRSHRARGAHAPQSARRVGGYPDRASHRVGRDRLPAGEVGACGGDRDLSASGSRRALDLTPIANCAGEALHLAGDEFEQVIEREYANDFAAAVDDRDAADA